MTRAFFGNFFAALYLLFATRDLHLTPLLIGVAIAGGGVGGLAGAALAPRLAARFGGGPTILLPGLAGALTLWLIPFAGGPPLVALMFLLVPQVLGDGLQTAAQINATSLRQTVLPTAALGRAGGAFAFGGGAMGVAGALVGGFVGALIGARWTRLIAAVGIAAASLSLILAAFGPCARLLRRPLAPPSSGLSTRAQRRGEVGDRGGVWRLSHQFDHIAVGVEQPATRQSSASQILT